MKSIRSYYANYLNFLHRIFRYGQLTIARRFDFRRYKKSIAPYKKLLGATSEAATARLLIASGRGMNIMWAQVWTFLALCAGSKFSNVYVLTNKKCSFLNRYYALIGMSLIDINHLLADFDQKVPDELIKNINEASCVSDFRKMRVGPVPIGDIAISTVCRHRGAGQIKDFDTETLAELSYWMLQVYKSYEMIKILIDNLKITHSFHTEVFMEEYGGIFYACLERKLKAIRFAGTVRDDAYIVQKLNLENARLHHSSLTESTWAAIVNREFSREMDDFVSQNFKDRYSDKWHRSKRNYPENQLEEKTQIYEYLNLSNSRPIAIVFSHILYDSIYFYGSDLYPDYEKWLIETIRLAFKNPNIEWIIKLHPSNLWRGESNCLLGEQTLEEKLIEKNFPILPEHIHILKSDSPISSISLMQIAKYGFTVRGTAGLEMAALGKTVITAGKGRYEGRGFTSDPTTTADYEKIIMNLQHLNKPNSDETIRARKYAYGIFELKTYTMESLTPCLSFGKTSVIESDDICYLPRELTSNQLGRDVTEFLTFLNDDRSDLLSKSIQSKDGMDK